MRDVVGPGPPHIFAGYGIELEYMIVRRDSLEVIPVADQLLAAAAGEPTGDVERGAFEWSNELALHVVEIKTAGPVADLSGLAAGFQREVAEMNRLLASLDATLLPSAMHPWMDPQRETRLWPHGSRAVYEAYHRIFDCRGHGWSNLQSVHLNLAFNGDEEFGRLHAAVRLVLPILPALAASSPFVEGRATGLMDNRLEYYRHNQRRIPSLSGAVIPEAIATRRQYEETILDRNYRDIAPHDPENILRHEWLNSRGAIARFERSAIEIRVIDIQECPAADLAIATAVVAVLRALAAGRWTAEGADRSFAVAPLAEILLATLRDADRARIDSADYLRLFGVAARAMTAGELWRHLIAETVPAASDARAALDVIVGHGPLARRLLNAVGESPDRGRLAAEYRRLRTCLAAGEMFL